MELHFPDSVDAVFGIGQGLFGVTLFSPSGPFCACGKGVLCSCSISGCTSLKFILIYMRGKAGAFGLIFGKCSPTKSLMFGLHKKGYSLGL